MTADRDQLLQELKAAFADPMWPDHAEVPKSLLLRAIEMLDTKDKPVMYANKERTDAISVSMLEACRLSDKGLCPAVVKKFYLPLYERKGN